MDTDHKDPQTVPTTPQTAQDQEKDVTKSSDKRYKAIILMVGLVIHSFLEGMGIGLSANPVTIFIGIVLHKGLAGFALGGTIIRAEEDIKTYAI